MTNIKILYLYMQEKEVYFTDSFYPKAKNIETKRFIFAVEKLINEGKVRSFKAIAEKAGFSSQDFTDIKTGRKALQADFLDKISRLSSINKRWILFGEGDIYTCNEQKEEEKQNDSETVKELMAAIKRRDQHVEALIRVNEKHADNLEVLIKVNEKYADTFNELLKQIKKTDAPKEDSVGCVGVAGGEIKK